MEPTRPHLLIEAGPEAGRELVIPAEGARLGRALENDITISDAAMSRFQCRLYFRDGFLHVMDLGSTNETLVNDQPISDIPLRYGDELLVGESLMRVVMDGLEDRAPASPKQESTPSARAAEAEEAAPAPILFQPDAADADSGHSEDVDLGLGRKEEMEDENGENRKRSFLPLLLVTLVTTVVVFGAGLLVMMETVGPAGVPGENDESIRVVFENVTAGEGNIFRYAVAVDPTGTIVAQVHDLRQQRSITRDERISAERLERFREQAWSHKDAFLSLQDEYIGLPVDSHESMRMTVIFGKQAKTVRVENQVEPAAFRRLREQFEAFVNNELGLVNIQIPPEELRERADASWRNARQLYEQRDVKNSNLYEATQKLRDVIFLLETIEPKPSYYREAVQLREEWMSQLRDRVRQLDFEAVRAYQVGNLSRAVDLYRRILATFPDDQDTMYQTAHSNLVRIEQELNR